MSRVPYMPFFGNDFFGSGRVLLMDPQEQIDYLRLLWFQWTEEGLPGDVAGVRRLVPSATDRVLECFPLSRDGKRRNPTLEGHRKSSKTMSTAQRKRAKSRWDIRDPAMPERCPDDAETDAQNMPSVSVSVAVSEVSSVATQPGEPDRKSDLATVMGAIRKYGYRNGKPPKKGDDARDATVAKHLLESHPVETVVRAVEGCRRLMDEASLGNWTTPGEPFTLRLLNSMCGGKVVFSQALDAYYAQAPPETTPEKRGGAPEGIGNLLREAG